MKSHLNEIETRLRKVKAPVRPGHWKGENYIGGGESKLKYLDHKAAVVSEAYDKGFQFSNLPAQKQWKVWDYVWKKSSTFEVMNLALRWAHSRPIEEIHEHRKIVLGWLKRVDNWAHSDGLSSLYSRLLEYSPKTYFPHFRKWNVSERPWERRQSLVGLFNYSSQRRRMVALRTVLSFVSRHLEDEHYYVQKGLGWTLRECYNVYPKQTYNYLTANAGKIHPAAWTAATEKLAAKDKQKLMTLRKRKK